MRRSVRSVRILAALAAIIASVVLIPSWSTPTSGKDLPRLFDGSFASRPDNPREPRLKLRGRRARAALQALDAPALSMNLFDNTELTVTREKVEHTLGGGLVWHGRGEDGSQAVLTVVNGTLAGTLYRDGQTFDVVSDGAGLYRIAELDAASFPTDDPRFDAMPSVADLAGAATSPAAPVPMADGLAEIDMLVVWTPAARNAVGGTQAAIQSLIQSAVANANLTYSNSGVNAHLNLVHAEEVNFTEGGVDLNLQSLRTPGDGVLDGVQALRDQYGADIVTLLGNGYVAGGTCGIAYIMPSPPMASFSSWAYNIVDQSCAAGYLSYAHEVGHNQGLAHDPSNASGSTPSYPYAYGYQDPGGAFRTVLSYGGAQRVPFLSNPNVLYNGRPTGTTSQNNAAALNLTAPIVAQFRPTAGTPPPCTYTVSPTPVSLSSAGGSSTVSVSSGNGCTWSSSSSATWVTVTGSGTGNGTVTVSAQANPGAARSATLTIAGVTVTVTQATGCSYSVSPTSLSFADTASSATVTVTTASGCSWTTSSSASWVTATSSGNGTATVTVQANTGAARSAAVTIAGANVAISQAAAPPPCTYSVSPASLSVAATAGSATVSVTTTSGCAWTTSSNASWIAVSAGATGADTVTLTVSANTGTARSATVVIAGRTVTVSQAALPCVYSVSPTSFSVAASAGTGAVTVTTTAACSWTTASNASWITASPGATGSGTATLTLAANAGAARTGTVVIAGQTVTISQAAAVTCSYTASPFMLSGPATAGTANVTITTSSGCAWTTSSKAPWLTVSAGGTGSGTATLTFGLNHGPARTTTAIVAGRQITVIQNAGK